MKTSFKPKTHHSSSKPLQLLHLDLFGPSRTASLGGKHYAFVIVDDFSRFTWVLFLKSKDEAFYAFSMSCKKVENEKVIIPPLFVVIMVKNLKIFTMLRVIIITFRHLGHLNKMV